MSPLPVELGDGAVLRRLTMGDLDEAWALVQTERDRLAAWMPWVAGTRTIEDQRAWFERIVAAERSLEGSGVFVDDAYVGGVGLMTDTYGISAEIGYWIAAVRHARASFANASGKRRRRPWSGSLGARLLLRSPEEIDGA